MTIAVVILALSLVLSVVALAATAQVGTRSVLYGAHQFLLHPLMLARAWYQLHGFGRVHIGYKLEPVPGSDCHWQGPPEYASLWRPALWVAFIVHDIGYWGKPNMDGPEGETHPEVGARIMRRLFGEPWGEFVRFHSRFLAKQHGVNPSVLCIADKLATCVTPRWLYLPMVRATGEIHEYMARSDRNNGTGAKYAGMQLNSTDQEQWYADMTGYMRRWVDEHRDGRADTWTPGPGTPVAEQYASAGRFDEGERYRQYQNAGCFAGREPLACVGCVSAEACLAEQGPHAVPIARREQ